MNILEPTDKELYSKIISDMQSLIKRKEAQKLKMKTEGRNKGYEYATVVNELSTLENSVKNLMIFIT